MVVDVKLDLVANKLLAATHGRGMYVAPALSARTTRTLAVTKSGAGAGTVSSSPAGIDCGATCVHDFDTGTGVTLTAVPASGSVFTGWSGDCSGSEACTLTMDADHPVTATFALVAQTETLTVNKAGAGSGTVTSSPAGIDCGATCSHAFDHGTSVTLTTTAGIGSTFTGWSGACSGVGTCTLEMDADQSVTATFALIPFTLTVDKVGDGTGTVSSSPAGIDCGATCTHEFGYGTEVTLTAVPAAGSSFTGWTGGCSGAGTCTLTMTGDRSAVAIFDREKTLSVVRTGTGAGSIASTPAGIDCGSTCTHAFAHGTSVTLTAQADSSSTFAGWSGACSGSGPCTVAMDGDRTATAEFVRISPPPPQPPPPPAARCTVPRVVGKTLATAKRAIKARHCAVGRVKKSFSRKRLGTVISQRPAPGKRLAVHAKVNLVVSKGRRR